MLKISKPGFNSTQTVNFQMFKLNLEKAKELEIKLPASLGSSKKQESSRKTSTSASLTMLKPLTVWITTRCEKLVNRWEYETTLAVSWGIVCRSKSNICNRIWKNRLIPYWERSTTRMYSLTLIFNLYADYIMWNFTLDIHKLESRILEEISTTSDM